MQTFEIPPGRVQSAKLSLNPVLKNRLFVHGYVQKHGGQQNLIGKKLFVYLIIETNTPAQHAKFHLCRQVFGRSFVLVNAVTNLKGICFLVNAQYAKHNLSLNLPVRKPAVSNAGLIHVAKLRLVIVLTVKNNLSQKHKKQNIVHINVQLMHKLGIPLGRVQSAKLSLNLALKIKNVVHVIVVRLFVRLAATSIKHVKTSVHLIVCCAPFVESNSNPGNQRSLKRIAPENAERLNAVL